MRTMGETMVTLNLPIEIEEGAVESLLVSALEGGSNYWYWLPDLKMVKHKGEPLSTAIFREVWRNGKKVPVSDVENQKRILGHLTRESMERAFVLMGQGGYRRHLSDFLNDNADSTTGDVWFQFSVMGEVVYG